MRPELLDLIHYRMERSHEALEEARLLIDNGHLRTGFDFVERISSTLEKLEASGKQGKGRIGKQR
jgi:hypothetical protein